MPLHHWKKVNGPYYKCMWCGLKVRIPSSTINFKAIKQEHDNFDITCGLVQGIPRTSKQYFEIWECPIGNQERKRINQEKE